MEIEQRIFKVGKDLQIANFATICEDGKPWVRYVLGMLDDDLTFRMSAQLTSRKVRQIKSNPNVHITLGVTNAMNVQEWLQIQGVAEITTDGPERHAFWNDSLKNIFKDANDPNYGVVIVRPTMIELEGFGEPYPAIWESSN